MDHAANYRKIFSSRTAEEVRTLARIKRFLELVMGDDRFRDRLAADVDAPNEVAAAHGIDLDVTLMRPLWQHGFTHIRYLRGDPAYPLAMAWDQYIVEMLAHRDELKTQACTNGVHPRFDAWRARQILRTSSECGLSGGSITHPLAAFELSDGCSVGCWFCGISAERFRGAYPYTLENARLWNGIQETMVDLFGDAAKSGFCYWATDPMDNPDYPQFIDDFRAVTGYLPQTTTAAPLKDVSVTRRVLALFERHGCITNRFSILTRSILERVHAEFTPDELMYVELVLQNKEALMIKAPAGKARDRAEQLKASGKDPKLSLLQGDHSTIACVSGFLVNMPRGTLRMVTPTRPSPRWRDGYKVLGTRLFDSVASFRAGVESLLDQEADMEIPGDRPVRIRPDLRLEFTDGGFVLANATVRHTIEKPPFARDLGRLLADQGETYGSILRHLVDSGADVLYVDRVLEDMHLNGILLEDIDLRDTPVIPGPAAIQAAASTPPAAPAL